MKTFKLPTQKQYPKSIHFSLQTYEIRFVKNLKHYGDTDPEKKLIRIKAGLSPRMTLTTFVHELLHVIEFEHPLKLAHKTVYSLEAAILELLLDNFL